MRYAEKLVTNQRATSDQARLNEYYHQKDTVEEGEGRGLHGEQRVEDDVHREQLHLSF